jgi:hypothetical protein
MDGLTPGLGWWAGSPGQFHGYTSGYVWCGNCLVLFPDRWEGCFRWVFLTTQTRGRVFVPETNPLWGPHRLIRRWATQGICSWVRALVMRAVGFTTSWLQTITNGDLILEALVRHVFCWSFDSTTTSSTYWRQWRVCYTSYCHGLHGPVGMMSCTHPLYVTCYFYHMFSLGPSSGSIDSVRIYRSVMNANNIHLIYVGVYAHKYIGHEIANWWGS